jgi:hypothetical protein
MHALLFSLKLPGLILNIMNSHAHTSNFPTETFSGTFASSCLGGFFFRLVTSRAMLYDFSSGLHFHI